ILYLLPVIGFIGTVEGISKALMNISRALPLVKNLDGFLSNLTTVTEALQIAFDSTLLALFLSAALMLVQTLVLRRSEELLARVDRWVVDHVLPRVGTDDQASSRLAEVVGPHIEAMGNRLARVLEPAVHTLHEQAQHLGESLRVPISQFTHEVQRLPQAFESFKQGAMAVGRIGEDLDAFGSASESLKRGVGSLARIETTLADLPKAEAHLEDLKRGLD